MKLKLLAALIITSVTIFADEITLNNDSRINYCNLEAYNSMSAFGIGTRELFKHHGYDINLSLDPIYMAKNKFHIFCVQANANYIYSFSQELKNIYTGIELILILIC